MYALISFQGARTCKIGNMVYIIHCIFSHFLKYKYQNDRYWDMIKFSDIFNMF